MNESFLHCHHENVARESVMFMSGIAKRVSFHRVKWISQLSQLSDTNI